MLVPHHGRLFIYIAGFYLGLRLKKLKIVVVSLFLLLSTSLGAQYLDSLAYYDFRNDYNKIQASLLAIENLDDRYGYYLIKSFNLQNASYALQQSDSVLRLTAFKKPSIWRDRALAARISFLRKNGSFQEVIREGKLLLVQMKDSLGRFDVSHNISISYRRLDQYDSALIWALPLQKQALGLEDRLRQHRALQNLANLYDALGDFEKTMTYERALIKIADQLNISDLKILDRCNLGSSFVNTGALDSAQYYFEWALELADQSNNQRRKALILCNLASLEEEKGNYAMVLSILEEGMVIAKETDQPTIISLSNYLVALSHFHLGSFDQAEQKIKEGLAYSASYGFLQDKRYLFELQAELYQNQNRWREAIATYKKISNLNEQILSDEKIKSIQELETKYETEKKEQQIANLEQQQQIAILQIQRQQFAIISAVAVLFVLFLLGYVFYKNRTLKLSRQRLMVEHQLLRSQMNPHFLFNALSSIHSYIFKGEKMAASEYLTNFSHLTRDILDQSSKNWITLEEELSTLESYMAVQKLRFTNVTTEVTVNAPLDPSEIQFPPVLLQPFVENAFEHGLKEVTSGRIEVLIQAVDCQIKVKISDNGSGLASTSVDHGSKATSIVRERLQILYGAKNFQLSIKNKVDDDGVVVSITLPKRQMI